MKLQSAFSWSYFTHTKFQKFDHALEMVSECSFLFETPRHVFWCVYRRKKKCIRYAGEDGDDSDSDDDDDDASKVDSTTTDGDLESMGSPMRGGGGGGAGSSSAPGPQQDRTASAARAAPNGVTSSTLSSTSSSSSSSSSGGGMTAFSSVAGGAPPASVPVHRGVFSPVAVTPSRPGVNHPIEKLCGGLTPPPQLQRPPTLGVAPPDVAPHRQFGVPSSSSSASLVASSSIVPALIATWNLPMRVYKKAPFKVTQDTIVDMCKCRSRCYFRKSTYTDISCSI